MELALEQGELARFIAPPNPWVGCLIVKDQTIISRGHTLSPGNSHAEICALKEAGSYAKGAALYVSLEPCPHFGRTPPCTDAIIKAGIEKVFVALLDPDTRVQGKGIAKLKEAGISVDVGLCADKAKESLTAYLHHRTTTIPFTIMKAAISMDGRIAAADGTSQWISSEEARQDAHRIRAASQAIIIGAGTALRDNPRLNVRHPALNLPTQPLRVLLDARGKVQAEGPLFDLSLAPTLVFTTSQVQSQIRHQWEKAGAEVIEVPTSTKGVDLKVVWKLLGQRGILQALVEGGPTLQTALLETGLANQLSLYIGPKLLGASGIPFYSGDIPTLVQAPIWSLQRTIRLGDTVRIDYGPAS